jgi:hypothetical protein
VPLDAAVRSVSSHALTPSIAMPNPTARRMSMLRMSSGRNGIIRIIGTPDSSTISPACNEL